MSEAWLRGPVPGVPAELMPVAHSLIDALEEMDSAVADLTTEQLWLRAGGAASVGFHLRHVCGSIDRLLTYARGESLGVVQLAAIQEEAVPGSPPASAAELMEEVRDAIATALGACNAADPQTLHEPREVGRARLPSTVHGLLFHVAEHTRRHAGQVVSTARIIRGLGLGAARDG
jgi:uncharacterized damage-inducible protein DinB